MKNFFSDPNIYFYYLREPNRQIFGGVCLKKIDNIWSRGISICSTSDRFDKNTCRRLAYKRLMQAMGTKQGGLPIKSYRPSCKKMYEYNYKINGGLELKYKCFYDARLTKLEQEITKLPNRKEK